MKNTHYSHIILIGTLIFSFTDCSMMEWGLNEKACDENAVSDDLKCLEGYSCRIDRCIADGFLEEGQTCNMTRQCADGLICPPKVFNCRYECSNYYESDPNCSNSTQCFPLFNSDDNEFIEMGACLRGECPESACASTKTCVEFKPGVGKCFTPCDYEISVVEVDSVTQGEYDDNVSNGTCHPVGPDDTMVEWPIGDKQVNEICHPVSAPCDEGLVCEKSSGTEYFCRQLCKINIQGTEAEKGCTEEGQRCTAYLSYDVCVPE